MPFYNLNFEQSPSPTDGCALSWLVASRSSSRYASFGTDDLPFEDFESEWVSAFKTAFLGIGTDLAAASFDSSPEAFEDFEEGWSSNESYAFGIAGLVATFGVDEVAVETFDREWSGNEDAIFAYVGEGTDLTRALFNAIAGAQARETFEAGAGWDATYKFAFAGDDLTAATFGENAHESFDLGWGDQVMTTFTDAWVLAPTGIASAEAIGAATISN